MSVLWSACSAKRAGSWPTAGFFVLTLEKNHEPGVNLGLNGRYAHSEDYVRDVSEEHGFAVLAVRDVQVRREMKQPVPSLAVALRAV